MTIEQVELTEPDILSRMEELAKGVLGVGAEEACARLDAGEMRGTIFASKMSMLRLLLEGDSPTPLAAE